MGEGLETGYSIGQRVRLTEACAVYALFHDEVGTVLERAYSLEKSCWYYKIRFAFGTYIFPQNQVQEVK